MLKKGDIAVFFCILLLSLCLSALFLTSRHGENITVTVDNEVYGVYPLSKNGEYNIISDNGENTLVIKNGAAEFKDSDCPDKTCESMGKISKCGETVVCLPHKVIAEVTK